MRRAEPKADAPPGTAQPARLPESHTTFEFRATSAHLLAAEEEERRRVSRELHDELGQRLALLELQIEEMERRLGSDPDVIVGLEKLRANVGVIADDVHRICYRLHPAILEHLGLVAALRSYCEEFSTWSGIKTRFSYCAVPAQLPPAVSLCVYRVVQEGLRNVAKHSRASRALVVLRGTSGGIQLVLRDDGRGFDLGRARSKGLGLTSLDERVRLSGGTCVIRSAPGRGTRIQASVPFEETPAPHSSEPLFACAG